ncbi:hypothetical protein HMPREF9220_1255 [Dialister micraerophilus UPII 345-E]|uniref:Uncharacterized protein n=1 Tax=Dialister micraerophilus UPII 345-E TaxID=910314 RepID=E4L7A7_9FIRM|nr:hypothetical protein HMPREF9220_1255 [Dialister micraerophilus UPII 345-E]
MQKRKRQTQKFKIPSTNSHFISDFAANTSDLQLHFGATFLYLIYNIN